MMDLALATCDPLPVPDPDQAPLSRALDRAGLTYAWFPWDDPHARFEDAKLVLVRSTWDYIHKFDAFLAWADTQGEKLVNPPAAIRWNAHKRYLTSLAAEGLAIVPTEIVTRGSTVNLGKIVARRGWADLVVKPAVSAGSYLTRRLDGRKPSAEDLTFIAALVAGRDAMIQPYVKSVEAYGERSLIVVDGEVTHAIRKTARFSGQSESISAEAQPIRDDERAFATRAMALGAKLTGSSLMYGRVDLAHDDAGSPLLMELELIEPSLFFTQAPEGLERYVEALARELRRR